MSFSISRVDRLHDLSNLMGYRVTVLYTLGAFNVHVHQPLAVAPILGTTVKFIALLLLPVITNYIKISARLGQKRGYFVARILFQSGRGIHATSEPFSP